MPLDAETDHELARHAAERAGEMLLAMRRDGATSRLGPWALGDAGDLAAHDLLVELLGQARPDDAVFSEEGYDRGARLAADRVWIIDPLDGSSDFGDLYSTDWAVQVALVEHGVPTAGAVAVPEIGQVLVTDPPARVPDPPPTRATRLVVSRRGYMSYGRALAAELDAEVMACGSVGVKTWVVVSGEADAYVHAAYLPEWDTCAPHAVAAAAGLWVSDLRGNPLVYNQPDATVEGFVVCRPELSDALLGALS